MRKHYFILFLSLFFVLDFQIARSEKIECTDIGYKYLHDATYQITSNIYIDCNAGFLSNDVFTITNGSQTYYVNNTLCCGMDVTPSSPNVCDRCRDASCTFGFGIQKWTMTADADFSLYKGCDFHISWTGMYLDTSSNTYSSHNVYRLFNASVACELNRCKGDRSSPYFPLLTPSIVCKGQYIDLFQYAEPGSRNDSLVQYPVNTSNGAGGSLSYLSPFTKDVPLSYTGSSDSEAAPNGFHYNYVTGELQFTANKVESSFLTIEADEYAKDTSGKYYLAGTSVRSSLWHVINCNPNHPPKISGINGTNTDTIYTCSNQPLAFNIKVTDPDYGDEITVNYLNETGGTLKSNSAAEPTYTFSWTPQNKDVSKAPYYLTMSAHDTGSPVVGQTARRFYIFVTDSLPSAKIKLTSTGCGKYSLGLTPSLKNWNLSYKWLFDSKLVSTDSAFDYQNNLAGRHVFSVIISNSSNYCSETLNDTVYLCRPEIA